MNKHNGFSSFMPINIVIILLLLVIELLTPSSAQAEPATAPVAYATGDIQFCPVGKPYEDVNCSTKRDQMNDALNDAKVAASTGVSGTVYVESGDYSGTSYDASGNEIMVYDFDYGTSLTIQGGVNGGTTTFVRRLRIWDNSGLDFSLKNVTLSPSDSSLNEHGFESYTNTGNFLFSNVQILDSNNAGTYIYDHTGDVNLQQVTADSNHDTNIRISDISGSATLNNIQSNNSEIGQGVVLTNIQGKKGVVLSNVVAQDNYYDNIYIDRIAGDATIKDSTISGSNNGPGIYIVTVHGKKGVVVTNTTVNSNKSANLQISDIDNSVNLTEVTANSSSAGIGIYIYSISGTKGISLTGITANGNYGSNINFTDLEGSAILKDIEANTSVLGYGIYFANIHGSKGVSIDGAVSNGNHYHNIFADGGTENVSLSNATANGSVTDEGIHLESLTNTTLSNVTASGNESNNLRILYLTGDVTLKTVTTEDSENDGGISIYGIQGRKGVTLSGVTANNNGDSNIYIGTVTNNVSLSTVNAFSSQTYRGVEIINVSGTKGVTLKNVFANGNDDENISLGNISGNVNMSNIEAQNSVNSSGLVLNGINGSKGVALTNAITSGNKQIGTSILNITGGVKISGLQSNSSVDSEGIYLTSINGTSGVVLTGVTADDNDNSNIFITDVSGNASLKTINANGSNTGYGLIINSIEGTKGVSLKTITAENNHDTNINLNTISGGVSIIGAAASGSNASNGFSLYNILGAAGVKIIDVIASSNHGDNISITSITGDVSLNGITAKDGGNSGMYIDTVNGSKGVTIKTADFTGNNANNLYIYGVTPGYAVLSEITADTSATANGLVVNTVDGVLMVMGSTFNGNNQSGITVSFQSGQASLKYVQANNNVNGNGVDITSTNNQLVCSSTFNENTNGYGLYSAAPGYSLTTYLVTTSGNATPFWYSPTTAYADNTKCAVIPAPPP
jgi:hypothetical protein